MDDFLLELEAKAMQAIEDKKYIELQRLKKQMEDAIAVMTID